MTTTERPNTYSYNDINDIANVETPNSSAIHEQTSSSHTATMMIMKGGIYDSISGEEEDSCQYNSVYTNSTPNSTSNCIDVTLGNNDQTMMDSVVLISDSNNDVTFIYLRHRVIGVAAMLVVVSILSIFTVPILTLLLLPASIHVIYMMRRPLLAMEQYSLYHCSNPTSAINMFLVMCYVGMTLGCFNVAVLCPMLWEASSSKNTINTYPTNEAAVNHYDRDKERTMKSVFHISVDVAINLCNVAGCASAIFYVKKLQKYM